MKNIFIGLLFLLNLPSMAQVSLETFVEERSFIIYDNVQNKYIGTYKDGKCYNGYFKTDYSEYEIVLVDYYEMGVIKNQYSKKFDLKNFENEDKRILDTKSIYKDSKIFNGIEYAFINKGLACKIWNDGKLENFTVHIFAMHYYNRFIFERQDSTIRITNILEEGDEIKYIYTNNTMASEHNSRDGSMRLSIYKNVDVLHLPKSSLIFYIKSGNEMMCKSIKIISDTENERQRFNVNIQVYESLKMPKSGNSESAFLFLADYFSKPKALDEIFYSDEEIIDDSCSSEAYLIAVMKTDSIGKIINGICWVNSTTPFYEEYLNGELLKKIYIDIQNFQKISNTFLETIMAEKGK